MPAIENNASLSSGFTAPARDAVVIVASDTVDLAYITKGLYVGGGGNIAAVMKDGTVVTFSAVPTGSVLPVRVSRVNATNTTATLMIGLY